MKKTKTLLCFIFLPFLVFSQTEAYKNNKISAYTDYFISSFKESQKQENRDESRRSLHKEFKVSTTNTKEYINAYIELDRDADLNLLKELGVKVNNVFDNIITARIPVDVLETVANLEGVIRVEIATPVFQRLDRARQLSKVNEIHKGIDAPAKYTGKGVVVGIIDGGFDYRHINFKTKAGSLRIKAVWDQNKGKSKKDSEEGTGEYGVKYETEESIINAKFDHTEETHGTHVVGIAAGSDSHNENPYYGVAPNSDIVLVSYDVHMGFDNVQVSDAIKYIYDYADSVAKPCVINMSLGSHLGPHDGTSYFDRISDKMQREGRLLVGSAGNEAEDFIHVSKNIASAQDTLKTFLDFKNKGLPVNGIVNIWGEKNQKYKFQVVLYDRKEKLVKKEISPIITAGDNNINQTTLYKWKDGIDAEVKIYNEAIDKQSQRYPVFIIVKIENVDSRYSVGIKIFDAQSTVNAWAEADASFYNHGLKGWSDGDASVSVGEIGGTGKRIITVGAYTSKTSWKTLSKKENKFGETMDMLASFSSQGPTPDGRMKPEITAPGTAIVSSYSGHKDVRLESRDYLVKRNTVDKINYYYGAMQGTSMSAPMVTGILACWLEANNTLSPENVKEIFKLTAKKDSFTGKNENNRWGYGKIDAHAGLLEILKGKTSTDSIDLKAENSLIKINFVDRKHRILSFSSHKKDLEKINIQIWTVDGRMVLEEKDIIINTYEEPQIKLPDSLHGLFIIYFSGKDLNEKAQKIII